MSGSHHAEHDCPSGLVHREMFEQVRKERDVARDRVARLEVELRKRLDARWLKLTELRAQLDELIERMGDAGCWFRGTWGGTALNARDADDKLASELIELEVKS